MMRRNQKWKQWTKTGITAVLSFSCLILFSANSRADNLFGEFQRVPDKIERGFSVGFDFGFMVMTDQKRSVTNPGFQLAITTGYDIIEYLSIEAITIMAINEASPLDPVLNGGVNSFLFNGALKGQYPLGRFYPFIEVGGGIHHSRPKFDPPSNNTLNILFGGGIEYYTYLRHYSLYVKALYHYMDLPIDAMTFSAGLKYTF